MNKTRKAPVTHKDVTNAYLLSGMNKIGAMLADHTDPVGTLDKVISFIEGADPDRDTNDLKSLRDKFAAASTPGQRGRKPAKVGDVRSFSVQRVGDDGDLFIRLPVNLLNVEKGSQVAVYFGANMITVNPLRER